MTGFSEVLSQGAANAWLFIPTAILLGALHGLEPGHSKTMMAAFIIAVRGTIAQAVLLGLSAAFSHSLVIWALAALALRFGSRWSAETTEPYFQLASAAIVTLMALWMFRRTQRELGHAEAHHHGHDHSHGHGHGHEEERVIDTGHGTVRISIEETGRPPVFRLVFSEHGKVSTPSPAGIALETVRPGGVRQTFPLVKKDGFLESDDEIPEPHEFRVVLTISHGDHSHVHETAFSEHGHDHAVLPEDGEYQDAHERAHAEDIRKRFADRRVTTWQIVLFGLTGGLMPCPAAFTVLIVCLQVKQYTLGFALVAAFSFGLALTMVSVGAMAAWSVRHAEKRFAGFGSLMRKAPYVSCALLLVVAAYMAWHGWQGLHAH